MLSLAAFPGCFFKLHQRALCCAPPPSTNCWDVWVWDEPTRVFSSTGRGYFGDRARGFQDFNWAARSRCFFVSKCFLAPLCFTLHKKQKPGLTDCLLSLVLEVSDCFLSSWATVFCPLAASASSTPIQMAIAFRKVPPNQRIVITSTLHSLCKKNISARLKENC